MRGSWRRAKGSGKTSHYFRWIFLQSSEGAQLRERLMMSLRQRRVRGHSWWRSMWLRRAAWRI